MRPLVLLVRFGKWRYLLTGLSLAVFIGLTVRGIGRIFAPFSVWLHFTGECAGLSQGLATVTFRDGNRIPHRVTFRTSAQLTAGETVRISVKKEAFAGGMADTPQEGVMLRAEERRLTAKAFALALLREMLICGIAAAVFFCVKRLCFPQ